MHRRLVFAALVLALVVALAVRLWGIQFGLPYAYARPDETEVAGPAVTYLAGSLRPQFFQWPSLFSYLVACLYALYGGAFGWITGHASIADFAQSRYEWFAPFLLIPRALSVTMGVVTVATVFALARRLFDDTVGVVAAWFLALAVLHVRDSHFGMSDVMMTGLVVLSTLATLWWFDRGGVWRSVVAGLLVGLAGSTKYNGLAAAAPFAVAALIGLRPTSGRPASADRQTIAPRDTSAARLGRVGTAVIAFGTAVAVGFFGGSPYILIEWSRFIADITTVQTTMTTGHGGLQVGRGWWYFGLVALPAGLGWPLFLASIAGLVLLPFVGGRRSGVVLAFPIAYYLYAGHSYSVFARYILPVVPFLCITAAWALVGVGSTMIRVFGRTVSERTRGMTIAAGAVALVAPSAWHVVQLDRLLATTDNRVVTARAVAGLLRPEDLLYQSGSSYGRVPVGLDGMGTEVREVTFDGDAGTFDPAEPTWILVQQSPLGIYSRVPDTLATVLREHYALVAQFPVEAESDNPRIYDQQDAFYLPLAGFAGLTRPGPRFELYRRR